MRKRSTAELDRKTVDECRAAPRTPLLLVLDNVRSLHNVGAVFRTADAFLLEGLYLCGYTGRPPHRDIHKTALGATETVPWRYFARTTDALTELREQGYAIWAAEQAQPSVMLQEFQPPANHPLAIVFGNEVQGVDEAVLRLADGCVGTKHSLNIAVSAGIVAWDLYVKLRVSAGTPNR